MKMFRWGDIDSAHAIIDFDMFDSSKVELILPLESRMFGCAWGDLILIKLILVKSNSN